MKWRHVRGSRYVHLTDAVRGDAVPAMCGLRPGIDAGPWGDEHGDPPLWAKCPDCLRAEGALTWRSMPGTSHVHLTVGAEGDGTRALCGVWPDFYAPGGWGARVDAPEFGFKCKVCYLRSSGLGVVS